MIHILVVFGYFLFGGCVGVFLHKARGRSLWDDALWLACMLGWPLVLPMMLAAWAGSRVAEEISDDSE